MEPDSRDECRYATDFSLDFYRVRYPRTTFAFKTWARDIFTHCCIYSVSWLSPAKLSSVPHYGLATWWQFMERFLLLCFFEPIRLFLTSQASSGLLLAAFSCLVIQLKIYFVFALAVEFKILQIISILVIYWVQ